MLLLTGCFCQSKEKAFIAKYEFEDFSQFKDVDMALRGTNKDGNFLVFGDAPHLVNDSSKIGGYILILNKNYEAIETKWYSKKDHIEADTTRLQHLAQTFMGYKIPRLNVDKTGNVFVYLKDFETLALIRFANENELLKRSKETKWINVKGNWYKPQ